MFRAVFLDGDSDVALSWQVYNASMDPKTPQQPKLDSSKSSAQALHEVAEQMDAERKERIEYLRSVAKPPVKERRSKAWLWVLLVLVVLAGGGFAGWWLLLRSKPAPQQPTQAQTQTKPSATANDEKPAMKHYDSSAFGIAFDYPEGSTVTDSGTSSLTVSSPIMQEKTAAGSSQNGKIVMSITSTAAALDDFKAGNATAVVDSEKISYTKPSSTQRAETYISFLGLASSAKTGLDSIYVSGDNGYQTGQAIPEVDIAKGDPHIRIAFLPCSSGANCSATATVPVTLPANIWQTKSFSTPIKAMLASITVE